MSRLTFRFSVMDALRAVLVASVCCAAVRHDLSVLASLAFTLTVGVLCFGIVGALLAEDRHRAFWTGFAVFGWVHLALAFYEWRDSYTDPATDWLFTSRLLYWFANRVEVRMDHWPHYWRIGHCVLTLMFGLVGALLSRLAFSIPRRVDGQAVSRRAQ